MNSKLGLLSVILLVQLGLTAVVWVSDGQGDADAQAWLQFDAGSVDTLVIADGDAEVSLSSVDGQWQVGGHPADTAKIEALLEKIGGVDGAWPVATTSQAAHRFEVAADNFQRRVELQIDGDAIAVFYLGTSPGYQRVHARLADSDDIFSISLSNFELPVQPDEWLDKSLLALADTPSDIRVAFSADGREIHLQSTDEGWLYNDAAAAADAAATYANRFKTLRVTGLADPQAEAQELARIDVQAGDTQTSLRILQAGDTDNYLIAHDDSSYTLAAYVAEQLLLTDVELAPDEQPEQE